MYCCIVFQDNPYNRWGSIDEKTREIFSNQTIPTLVELLGVARRAGVSVMFDIKFLDDTGGACRGHPYIGGNNVTDVIAAAVREAGFPEEKVPTSSCLRGGKGGWGVILWGKPAANILFPVELPQLLTLSLNLTKYITTFWLGKGQRAWGLGKGQSLNLIKLSSDHLKFTKINECGNWKWNWTVLEIEYPVQLRMWWLSYKMFCLDVVAIL